MPSGFINFPGINDPRHAVATRTLGVRPNTAMIWATPIDADNPDTSGAATFTYGFNGINMTWTNCLCDRGTLRVTEHGQFSVYMIRDKRWRWSRYYVTQACNVRQADGTIDSATQFSLAQIITNLFGIMGETVDTSAITSNEQPEIILDHDNCADAIEEILSERGYVVSLMPDDSVKIFVKGFGFPIPNDGDVISVSFDVDPPEVPNFLTVVGGKTLVQSKLKCVPVGIDTDRKIKAVNDLSYKPTGGWDNTNFETFDSLTNATAKELAKMSVGKWYQVSTQADSSYTLNYGGTNYCPGEISVTSAFQYLPLDKSLVSSSADVFGKIRYDQPYVEGTFFNYLPQGNLKPGNSTAFSRADRRDWELDRELGIVKFKDAATKKNPGPIDGATTFADVYLTCAYSIHPATTYVKDRFTRSVNLGGIGEDVKKLESLQRRIVFNYTSGTSTVSSVTDNLLDVQTESDYHLATAINAYQTHIGTVVHYRGIKLAFNDGINQQIRWNIGVNEAVPFSTSVSQYTEGLPLLPTDKDRMIKRRAAMARNAFNRRRKDYQRSMRRLKD